MNEIENLDFDKMGGLLPAIVQDAANGEVLMLAFMNREAWERTLATGEAHYYSRTRNTIWHKGDTSGNVQRVQEIYLDCDQDTVLLKVEQVGGGRLPYRAPELLPPPAPGVGLAGGGHPNL